ncbi:MAG TPA: carboxypeptidase-like regulatory domain-containing protein, partial [Phnomibacter sp.]|nr:carboxypeptidase-like regulatory domain-containing protein [Phnomibacter sp.]
MKKTFLMVLSPWRLRGISLLLFALIATTAMAQRSVSGTVKDDNNAPVSGATISLKGKNAATLTNNDGKFSIMAGENDVLVITYVGYVMQEIRVGNRTSIDVSLAKLDASGLDEVVVTALGIKKESKKLGYAITNVKTDELVTNRTTNVMESLEGKVAGLNITPPAAGAGA